MGKTPSTLSVAVCEQSAFIRITGRANFSSSVNFKTLINELKDRGYRSFTMDLSECLTMDSTFLGVLAGFALRSADENPNGNRLSLQLLNPNHRIADLLENLGVANLFEMKHGPSNTTAAENSFEVPSASEAPTSKEELNRTCLEAHETLMAINPNNIPKFKDVAQFLAEDLKKSTKGGSSGA